jgi:hypothetical protein
VDPAGAHLLLQIRTAVLTDTGTPRCPDWHAGRSKQWHSLRFGPVSCSGEHCGALQWSFAVLRAGDYGKGHPVSAGSRILARSADYGKLAIAQVLEPFRRQAAGRIGIGVRYRL